MINVENNAKEWHEEMGLKEMGINWRLENVDLLTSKSELFKFTLKFCGQKINQIKQRHLFRFMDLNVIRQPYVH